MKTSELIQKLQKLIAIHGDLDCLVLTGEPMDYYEKLVVSAKSLICYDGSYDEHYEEYYLDYNNSAIPAVEYYHNIGYKDVVEKKMIVIEQKPKADVKKTSAFG